MIEESTTKKILNMFFENPNKKFHLRELSRSMKVSLPTILTATETLAKEKLIIKEKGKVMTLVYANLENKDFIRRKRVYNLQRIYDSNIVDNLAQMYGHPQAIILFGSFSRGEDRENSDIDIAVFSTKKISFKQEKYEKIFKKIINIHEIEKERISSEFKANLHNGILLEGSW
ncbi:MAG TPA: nucleotidyltransferase domain-containing protein [Nanoarchaeota archaeon]|nr:nucleotidyltransferase domain-containing protein [Candidatus Woesearchaeota archaeon]HIH15104.1 nucleotidyltransferase domain-containing protein [Nanoarchaeota archaeon]HIH58809.1 nucleotidyltransferase domain-containing protein [Nanoarchaeota archaeon]HII14192.1 nucleotidyltransferase domain-containing protein [Nanoarchaeota archaeon]HIJ04843.1 nucleotidyltransferase domain-containing protein [Nanoarchaeota archaeon]